MKILSITAQKPHSTGSGTYLTELVRSFDRKGIRQAVVAGIYESDTVDFPEGVQFFPVYYGQNAPSASMPHTIPYPVVGMSDVMPYESTRYRDLTPEMLGEFEAAFIGAVSDAVKALEPDIILCHHLFLLTALVRKHFPDRIIYGICHGTDLRQMINCVDLRRTVRPEIQKLDRIFALHSKQAEEICSIHEVSSELVSVIGSGYNNTLFNSDGRISYTHNTPVRICYAGKMSGPKGVPELIEALNILSGDKDMPDFTVTMAGGCQDEDVMKLISGFPENISWLGQVPQHRLADIFRNSDIFVLPSYFEGLNLAVIEAMACGLVPVSTDLPGMKEWIDAHVKDPNVCYIPMPEMQTVDSPTSDGRHQHVRNITEILGGTIKDIAAGIHSAEPDTSSITWDGLSEKLLIKQ